MKPGKNKDAGNVFYSKSIKHPELSELICFIHAFTGYDTTSCFFNKGKTKLINLLVKYKNLRELAKVFNDPQAKKDDLAKNSITIILALYGAPASIKTLWEFRYHIYKKFTERKEMKTSFKLENLPPTESAAALHAYRVYYQIQLWLENSLEVTEWGWKFDKEEQVLIPVQCSEDALFPQGTLKKISCSWKGECSKKTSVA